MITVEGLSKSFFGQTILSNVNLSIGRDWKAALVGPNGVGKSTLLRIIAGVEEPDSGSVDIHSDTLISYLPQEVPRAENISISAYLRRATQIEKIENRLNELEKDLNDPQKLEEYGELQQRFIRMDGYTFDHKMHVVLTGFGLDNISVDRPLSMLSGGQRSKVALAGVLLNGIDLLLLDEPTNNLDLPALIWLEEFLAQSSASLIVVSHDRKFLDNVVNYVFEIDWYTRGIKTFRGGYTDYIEFKAKELQRQKEAYELQQEEIKRLKNAAREQKMWAQKGAKHMGTDNDKFSRGAHRDWSASLAKRGKAIEQHLEQMEKLERPVERSPLVININPLFDDIKHAIRLESVVFRYDHGFKLGPINLDIRKGMRVGILGSNGSGKSTLLKLMTGLLQPQEGHVTIGSSIVIGNLLQFHENLAPDLTLFDFLKQNANLDKQYIYNLLAYFHFEATEVTKLIQNLSPGGRARLLLALFSAQNVNTLILDEPTNHLDIEAVEALEIVLKTYEGIVVIVSHDRFFLETSNLTHTYLLNDGILETISSFKDYAGIISAKAKRLLQVV